MKKFQQKMHANKSVNKVEAMKPSLAAKYRIDDETFEMIRCMVHEAIKRQKAQGFEFEFENPQFKARSIWVVYNKVRIDVREMKQDMQEKVLPKLDGMIEDIFDQYIEGVRKDPIEIRVEEEDDQKEKEEENDSRVPADNVNLCFVGGVSTGKSTILNAIFCEQLTQCKIKRTTMVPTIYIENESNPFLQITDPEEIFKQIAEKNAELIARSENGEKISRDEYSELVFNVGKLDINILPDAYVNVYDIPGLNDARTKDIYYEYLEHNFHKFNLLIFIVDIHSGLNTSDEIDIVHFITRNTRHQLDKNNKKIYTMVIVNKADDMQLDEDSDETDKLCLTGELSEMYDQVVKTVRSEFERQGVLEQLIGIIPLCAIDSYLYRMVKKHGTKFKLSPEQILKIGVNENGKKFSTLKPATQEKKVYEVLNDATFIETMIKLSGFSCLEKTLHKFLTENGTGKSLRVHNLLFQLRKYDDIVHYLEHTDQTIFPKGFEELVQKHDAVYQAIRKIDPDLYGEQMSNIVQNMQQVIERKLACYSYQRLALLLADFQKLNDRILSVYFDDFYGGGYFPGVLQEHVYKLLLEHNQQTYAADMVHFLKDMRLLKWAQFYHAISVSNMLQAFVSKSKMNDWDDDDYDEDYDDVIAFCDDLQKLGGIDLTHFLRFVILQQIKNRMQEGGHDDFLFLQKMLYHRCNEIPIQNYLLMQMHKLAVSDKVVMNGLSEEPFSLWKDDGDDLKLDIYYLRYMKLLN